MSALSDAGKLWAISRPLVARYLELLGAFPAHFPELGVGIAQGYRTISAQRAAHAGGRSDFDGVSRFSKHQELPSLAVDFAVLGPAGAYITDGAHPAYTFIGEFFEGKGFTWGGRWPDPDFDHVEMSAPGPDRDSVSASLAAWLKVTTGPARFLST